MAIRLRKINNITVALCAAATKPKEEDVYLDDGQHHALICKFERDWVSEGLLTMDLNDPEHVLMERIENNKEKK